MAKSDIPMKIIGVLGEIPLTGCVLDVDIQNAYLAKGQASEIYMGERNSECRI